MSIKETPKKEKKKKETFQQKLDRKLVETHDKMYGKAPIVSLEQIVKDTVGLTDLEWGIYAFARDTLRGKCTREMQEEFITKSVECGKEKAKEVNLTNSKNPVFDFAEAKGIVIRKQKDSSNVGGGRVLFASFEAPNIVTYYEDIINRTEDLLSKYNIKKYLGDFNLANVLISHELFHYFEENEADKLYTQTLKIKVNPFPIIGMSRINCLGEIGAMAFAKELNHLKYSPYIFDLIILYSFDKQIASNLYDKVLILTGKKKNTKLDG